MNPHIKNNHTQSQPQWVSYLLECRRRLLRFCLILGVTFIVTFYFSGDLYHVLAIPLLRHLPKGSELIATGIAAPLITPLKLSFFCALFICVPWLLFEVWGFIAPALYQREKRYLVPLFLGSLFLFFVGMCFAYFVVFPLIFQFMIQAAPSQVKVMPDISHYLDFTLKLFFAFGIAFEVPIVIFLLIFSGLVSSQSLAKKRPIILVAAFILGMLLTPPDVLSQILLAIPLWLLFELGLLAGKLSEKHSKTTMDERKI